MEEHALKALGERITCLRQQREWSLSHLAERAGIAKSNLSRIEQGIGNPTLDTLWRMARQLEVPFGTLVAPAAGALIDSGMRVTLLEQGTDDACPVDAYLMHCDPHSRRIAEAHTPHTRERVEVIHGHIRVGPTEAPAELDAGDSLEFNADCEHLYEAGDQPVAMLITILHAPRRPR
ncbi:XRE family transcriptional regulator [Kushneria sinocarnis]|uniref:XRE family transcriptional regulator n=1 Tax=Kushneria sinocarnis TaxID=595502 RepID=A0A420WZB9_9GAMM|nr:XRE family transcriptional regulator [Kushneria sinocarnis]RKR06579.1 XRE family transcriptional regulator [Kushneria sinocarnis]